MKTCTKCLVAKDLSEFYYEKKSAGYSHRAECRGCTLAYKRAYHIANREHIISRQRRHRENPDVAERKRQWALRKNQDPEYANRQRENRRLYKARLRSSGRNKPRKPSAASIARSAEKRRAYRRTPEGRRKHILELVRYRQRHPETSQMQHNRRRAWLNKVVTRITKSEWRWIKASYGNKCLCCLATGRLTMDHVIPLSRGGTDTADNIQPLCLPCNARKGTRTIDYRTPFNVPTQAVLLLQHGSP